MKTRSRRLSDAHALIALVSILVAMNVHAEPMYVVDKLVINVYAEADQESERLATLETGDRVETVEELGEFVRVRLEDEREGWVAANYLTAQAPAAIRLQAMESEHKSAAQKAQKKSNDEISALKQKNADLLAEVDALKKKAAAPPPVPEKPIAAPAAAQVDAPTEIPSPQRRMSAAWLWAPLTLLAGGLGYLLGYQALARRIRNKFGGVKIY